MKWFKKKEKHNTEERYYTISEFITLCELNDLDIKNVYLGTCDTYVTVVVGNHDGPRRKFSVEVPVTINLTNEEVNYDISHVNELIHETLKTDNYYIVDCDIHKEHISEVDMSYNHILGTFFYIPFFDETTSFVYANKNKEHFISCDKKWIHEMPINKDNDER